MLRNLRHYFYAQVKEIVEHHYDPQYYMLQWVQVVGYCFYSIRAFFVIHMMIYETEYYRYYDFLDVLGHYYKFYNRYFFVLLLAMAALALVGKKVFFFTHVNTLSYQIIYDICVRHMEIYWRHLKPNEIVREIESRRQQEIESKITQQYSKLVSWIPGFFLNKFYQLAARLDVWNRLDHVRKRAFMRESLPLFPSISFHTRSRMIVWLDFLEFGIYNFFIFIFMMFATFAVVYGYLICPHFAWWYPAVYLVDIPLFAYLVLAFVQCGILFTLMATYCSIIYIYHFNDLNRIFANIRSRVRLHHRLSHVLAPSLQYITRQHTIIVYYILYTNKDVWSNALLLYVIISVPLNAYMVSLTLMDIMTNYEVVLMFILIIGHILLGAIPLISVAFSINANYRFKKFVVPVQYGLRRDQLYLKLKLDDIFGQMSHGQTYGLTIGSMSAITFTYLFELILTYVVVFFFVLDKKPQLT